MHLDQPGPVTDRITLLGRNESCLYLVDGLSEYAILGGSMTYVAPDLMAQVRDLGVDPQKIRRLVIHHAHFDHVGLVPYLKQQWPWIQVTASARARDLLARTDVVETIVSLNRMLLSEPEAGKADPLWDSLGIKTLGVDEVVEEGQILTCGDLDLLVLSVPGHSSCSMAIYIPQEKAMAASDAGGIPFGDRIFAAANANFDLYQQSLEKMAAYPSEVHLSEHYGALTGPDGQGFMARSMAEAARMRTLLEETHARLKDPAKTVAAILAKVEAETPHYFLPREVMEMVLGQMVRFFDKKAREGR